MIRRPPRSKRMTHSFPTRRSSDLQHASARRLEGYRAALEERGAKVDDALIAQGLFTYRSGLDAAEILLARDQPPTAIFASNDDMAAAAVAVAHRRGVDVPGDLSICGFDDTPFATRSAERRAGA